MPNSAEQNKKTKLEHILRKLKKPLCEYSIREIAVFIVMKGSKHGGER